MIEDKSMFDWWSIQHFTAGVIGVVSVIGYAAFRKEVYS